MTAVDQPELMGCDFPAEERVCPHLRRETQDEPVRLIRTPAGDEAWLVSRHAEVQELHRDNRLGRSHPAPEERPQYCGDPTYDSVVGNDHQQSDEMYTGMRKLLKPQFGTRRMQAIQPRIDQFISEGIDALLAEGPPAGLRTRFTDPLMRRITCELIGVPEEDTEEVDRLLVRATEGDLGDLWGYFTGLVAAKREEPDDSLASAMVESGITDEEVVGVLFLTQLASLSPVGKKVDYGLLLLTEHPEERAAITADPSLLPLAVEEILRLAGNTGLPRFAREDIEIAGVTIRKGDLVLLDLTRANFDPAAFDEPTRLDITRSPNRHMTFSHGVWTCVGAPLARNVLVSIFESLLTRMPDLRPTEPVSGTSGPLSGGLREEVLFTW